MMRANVLDSLDDGGPIAVAAWPYHLGVEGLSVRAAGPRDGRRTAAHALAALHTWLSGAGKDVFASADGLRPDGFPFGEVLAHYQAVGRSHVDPALTEALRALADALGEPGAAGGAWPLPEWLPSTVDQETGNYDTYLASRLLESLDGAALGAHPGDGKGTDEAIDVLLGALAADLARLEADALLQNPDNAPQLQRARACLVVLSRLPELAPRWPGCPVLPADPAGDRSDPCRLAEATGRMAAEVGRHVPGPWRRAVELSLLPTTPLHDELMFIRTIQIFETLYRQIHRCLVRAAAAAGESDVPRARAEVADAVRRLELSPVLYRVVTTMPRPAFAIIREYTHGRSAIQSRAFRQIHLASAPQGPSPVADKLPRVKAAGPTLQDVFLALAARLSPAEVEPLAAEMRALDAGWRGMKRTHWGVTLKIIGSVPGTGGTTGADYLKQAAELPLFPALAAR